MIPGDVLRTYARVVAPVLDGNGDPVGVLGLTMTPDLLSANGTLLDDSRFSFLEMTNGFYEIQLQTEITDPYGQYEIHFHANNTIDGNPENSSFTHVWDLVDSSPLTATENLEAHGETRRTIRRMVAGMLGDHYVAHASTGGTFNKMIDPVVFARETNHFQGMQVLFSDPVSPNFRRITTVTYSDQGERAIYFDPPVAAPVLPGEEVELYNFKGRGNTVQRYNEAINAAIMVARQQHALIPYSSVVDPVFDYREPWITIPQRFRSIYAVEATMYDGKYWRLPYTSYTVDRYQRRIRVKNSSNAASRIHGREIVLLGHTEPAVLINDEDRTVMDVDWVFSEVKANLLERLVANGQPIAMQDRLFLQERGEAGGKRGIILNHSEPNNIRLH